jgi:myo-inositol-1(or 4)-monophosphatase
VRNSFLDVAVDVAQESGAMLVEAFGNGVQSETKGRLDIVTDADRASERLIVGRIRSEFPTHAVVSEEGGGHAGGPDPYCWYVDPLDGTRNFAREYPAFSVSLALKCGDELVLGVVFDPMRQELFAAERQAGAFCNGRRINVSRVRRLEQCLMATGFPSAKRHAKFNTPLFHHICMTTQGLRRTGSSALDLSYVACGRIDAFWDIGLSAWDVAAGVVLVSEAGGCYSDLQGGRVSFSDGELLADNALVHGPLVQAFSDLIKGGVCR